MLTSEQIITIAKELADLHAACHLAAKKRSGKPWARLNNKRAAKARELNAICEALIILED